MVRPDPRQHGDIKEWPVGLMFADRKDLYQSGLHGVLEAGIFGTKEDNGAFSIVLNKGYEDDDDRGNTIKKQATYQGNQLSYPIIGKGKPENGQEVKPSQQQGHQDMKSPGNAALQRNVQSKLPVRVVRGPDGNVLYSPSQGYRYDGLYDVLEAYMEFGKAGFKMCTFKLQRCVSDKYWSPDGPETLAAQQKQKAAASFDSGRVRTVEEINQEITGHKKLPNIRFKKTTAPAAT
ncbi:PUA-like domain-containing protein [Mycena sp. CBHHK59/15]|nr:PUA-like domain-containing protein [Mycena sp. CBHHK59/15]